MDEKEAENVAGSSSDADVIGEANVFRVIRRRYEPVPDPVDRLRFIDALLSLPSFPLE